MARRQYPGSESAAPGESNYGITGLNGILPKIEGKFREYDRSLKYELGSI